jgi:hypothetical protein
MIKIVIYIHNRGFLKTSDFKKPVQTSRVLFFQTGLISLPGGLVSRAFEYYFTVSKRGK